MASVDSDDFGWSNMDVVSLGLSMGGLGEGTVGGGFMEVESPVAAAGSVSVSLAFSGSPGLSCFCSASLWDFCSLAISTANQLMEYHSPPQMTDKTTKCRE